MPERACPFQCIFCDQQKITSQLSTPNYQEITHNIEQYLAHIPEINTAVQVAFFGGTFTGIPMTEQRSYLQIVQPFIQSRKVEGIRISTRPDYINQPNLELLKEMGVTHIELGAQSLVDHVLAASYRGHNSEQVKLASELIKANGFVLGLQMMLGLPGDSPKFALETAQKIIDLGAEETRIYPTLVIKGTALEQLMQKSKYIPMTTEVAIIQSAQLYQLFEEHQIKVLRVGLYPDEDLLNNEVIAGPDMKNFKEKVMTHIWSQRLNSLLEMGKEKKFNKALKNNIIIHVAPNQLNFAIGFQASNRKALMRVYNTVKFKANPSFTNQQFDAHYI
mgnify:FL=1